MWRTSARPEQRIVKPVKNRDDWSFLDTSSRLCKSHVKCCPAPCDCDSKSTASWVFRRFTACYMADCWKWRSQTPEPCAAKRLHHNCEHSRSVPRAGLEEALVRTACGFGGDENRDILSGKDSSTLRRELALVCNAVKPVAQASAVQGTRTFLIKPTNSGVS